MSTPSTVLEIGSNFAGYRITAMAGRGGMGMVYCAEQPTLERRVALKLIAPELAQDAGFRERFKRESRLAASIDDPNVIPVYEAGEADGRLFIAMRYVEGTDLGSVIASEGALAPARAARIVAAVGSALDAAHERGLVHRDVKPGNILIAAPREHVYLVDFGLTKLSGSGGQASALTRTGEWVGTLDFVAPEQVLGHDLDARADIYSLGCVLFVALTGHVPYELDSDVAKMWAHINSDPPSLASLAPQLASAFDPIVARAMAKDPGARYPSAGDLGRAALAAADARTSSSCTSPATAGPPATPRTSAQPTTSTSVRPPPRADPGPTVPTRRSPRPILLAALGLLVAAGVAGGILAALGGGSARPPVPAGASGTTSGVANRDAVVATLRRYETAFSTQDLAALGATLTPDVLRHGLRAGGCSNTLGRTQVLQAYHEEFAASGSTQYHLTALSSRTVQVNGATAQVATTYRFTPGTSGTISFGLVHQGSQWLINRVDASC